MNKKYVESSEPFFIELLKNPDVRVCHEKKHAKARIAISVDVARKSAKLIQVALAKKAGTSQGVIDRLGSGNDKRIPSMPLLSSIAETCGRFFVCGFTFKKQARHKAV